MKKTYLGDSVYASCDNFSIILTTENDSAPSNTIVLEPEIVQELFLYAKEQGFIIT